MRTINKILKKNNITLEELKKLEKEGKVNGIGGEGFNLDKLIKAVINCVYGYDCKKCDSLFADIRILALIHDKQFYFKEGFIRSNFNLSKNIYLLFNWTGFFTRFGLSLLVFIITSTLGKKYYFK